jgi:L,D-peptidoglycan transpeptidase YkuD (ErfK/YbiS/YcfS/YnhG family)
MQTTLCVLNTTSSLNCMNKILLLLLLAASTAAAQLGESRQLIVSVSPEWASQRGTMMLLEKGKKGWDLIGTSWPVTYGDSGMAWGIGVHAKPDGGRLKREGDRRSPAGIFRLGTFCGYDSVAPAGVRYPYVQSTATTRWVDDPQSVYYNKMIDEKKVPKSLKGKIQWRSAEHMKFTGIDYKYVIEVKHNPACIPGTGSAIFLHLNAPQRTPTSGCTAMDEEQMLVLLKWIDPVKKPLLVQVPLAEYSKYMKQLNLPRLP